MFTNVSKCTLVCVKSFVYKGTTFYSPTSAHALVMDRVNEFDSLSGSELWDPGRVGSDNPKSRSNPIESNRVKNPHFRVYCTVYCKSLSKRQEVQS